MKQWSYVGTYQMKKLKFFAQAIPFGPEKVVLGVHGRHGKRLDTYAELKIDQADKTETMVGFKTKFIGGEVRGNITSTGKVSSVYRKFIQIFELELQSEMDLGNPKAKAAFGVALSMRQMWLQESNKCTKTISLRLCDVSFYFK